MSRNVQEIYTANPSSTVANDDLVYLVQYPYTSGYDSAILYSDWYNQLNSTIILPSTDKVTGLNTALAALLPIAGGTMTGRFFLNSDPMSALEAATKQYVDTSGGAFLPLIGGTMTGAIVLPGSPTSSLQATTKGYTDAGLALKLNLSGGTMSGDLILDGNPTLNLGAATKQYVDYNDSLRLLLAGGTMQGTLILAGNPMDNLDAATKQYVDIGDSFLLPLAGGTMLGDLILDNDPTVPLQAATKHYVDIQVSAGTAIAKLMVKASAVLCTVNNLNATYNNGASGVGATLTNAGLLATLFIDGFTPQVNDLILIPYQATKAQNGLYVCTNPGSSTVPWILTRSTSYDGNSTSGTISIGDAIFVAIGVVNSGKTFLQTNRGPFNIGTTIITFAPNTVASYNQYGGFWQNTTGATAILQNEFALGSGSPGGFCWDASTAKTPSNLAWGQMQFEVGDGINTLSWRDDITGHIGISYINPGTQYSDSNYLTLWPSISPTFASVQALSMAATNTITASLFIGTGFSISANRVFSANYTFQFSDAGRWVYMLNEVGNTAFNIPLNSVVPFPLDTEILVSYLGGATSFQIFPNSGVTINTNNSLSNYLAGQFSVAFLKQTSINVWQLTGQLLP